MISSDEIRVAYVGAGGSGRSTSVWSVLAAHGSDLKPYQVGNREHRLLLEVDGVVTPTVLSANRVRGWLHYEDPLAKGLDAELVSELDLLPTFDGFVFVVDSRSIRWPATEQAFQRLGTDLLSRGKALATVPVVFQANFRDEDKIQPMALVRSTFQVPRCAYAETVASDGAGVLETLRTLVRLIIQ